MITFDNVNFKYKDSDSGLFNIDMEIKDGEFVLLAGESGCGKTTITRLINGLIPAFYEGELSGALRLDGTDISSMTITQISRLVGSVFQDPSTQFFTTDTTSEIAFPCENAGMNWEQIVQKVETAVNYLSIEHLLGKSIFNLSSGEKQSVAIASVFTLSPSIYVFDEPSANLDTESTLKLQSILKTLKDAGNTIIISEHKLYYLWELVDKVVFMQKGHIERIFSGEEYRGLSNLDAHHMGLRCTQMEMVPFVHANFSKNQEIVKADNVSFSYGKNRTVLNRVSFHAQQGQITGIIGHNGVGKSTLLELMCGIKKQKEGSFIFQGKVLNNRRRLRNSYYVMQECSYQLFTESVYNELLLGDEKNDRIRQKAEYIMDFMDLSAYKEQHPAALSGGQKQRLAIAVAYMKDSEVICMDEPTSGLDYANMEKVKALISQLSKEGKTVFIISHDYEFLANVCTHIIEIGHAQIVDDYPLTEATVTKLFDFFISAQQNAEKEAI